MLPVIGLVLLLVLLFGPQLWVRHVLKAHAVPIPALRGTGGELAIHLVERLGIDGVAVEAGAPGADHYDPEARKVRLSPEYFNGKSLTAIVIAAHEVGHALQHHLHYAPLLFRTRIATVIRGSQKFAGILLIAIPVVALITRTPAAGAVMLLAGAATMLLPVALHLATLPVEWDASFRRALPVLVTGGYIEGDAVPKARQILTAAALTYVAASLASLLNLYRWLALLRR